MVKFQKILLADKQIYPHNPYSTSDPFYSDNNWNEYQSLVTATGSVQFQDSGKRYRFNNACYIGNRIAVNVRSTTMTKVNLDTLTVTQTITLSQTPSGRIWFFGNNRILTSKGIMDFNGNFKSTFNYDTITPGLPGIVWANSGADIYKGIVSGDNISFTKVGTGGSTSTYGRGIFYGRTGAYLLTNGENSSQVDTYINPATSSPSNFSSPNPSSLWNGNTAVAGADGKLYRLMARSNGWGRLQKIGTGNEGVVGDSLDTTWGIAWGGRFGKFLGNIVSGNMNTNNGTGNGLGSNNYFINTSGTLTKVQTNAFAYDTDVFLHIGFIDENGLLYPATSGGGSGVILKTNKTFTDLPWRNPFLRR